jgi:chemotaxis protein methyltransferase CheR
MESLSPSRVTGIPGQLSDPEFRLFRDMMYALAGIHLSDAKKQLVAGRLAKRLRHFGLESYRAYFARLQQDAAERQMAVDLLTTNETYFFREPRHFEFLRDEIIRNRRSPAPFRVWSAASSTGEEAYTLAMLLADTLSSSPWEIVGSDISTQVLAKAEAAHYPMERNEGIPPDYLVKYCLKGVRAQSGTFLIAPELRRRVRFVQINLTLPVEADIGEFDVIFLRNVMIYFDMETKRKVVANLLPRLKRGGHLIIGHSETLNGIQQGLEAVRATIYRKPLAG